MQLASDQPSASEEQHRRRRKKSASLIRTLLLLKILRPHYNPTQNYPPRQGSDRPGQNFGRGGSSIVAMIAAAIAVAADVGAVEVGAVGPSPRWTSTGRARVAAICLPRNMLRRKAANPAVMTIAPAHGRAVTTTVVRKLRAARCPPLPESTRRHSCFPVNRSQSIAANRQWRSASSRCRARSYSSRSHSHRGTRPRASGNLRPRS